jgi:prepilin-type N-terminal cleavage/methylation domain-containing protein
VNSIRHYKTVCRQVHAACEERQTVSMNVKTWGNQGFTMVEIMIVVATIGLLASVAIPNYVKSRSISQQNACINNLRQLDGAVQQWAVENKKAANASVTLDDATPYLKRSVICPAGGTVMDDSYEVTTPQTPPTCISPGGGSAFGHVFPQ